MHPRRSPQPLCPGNQFGEAPYSQDDAVRWIRKAAEGEPQLFEWLAKDKNGKSFWVEVNLRRAVIGGQDRILAVVRDTTETQVRGKISATQRNITEDHSVNVSVGIGLAKDREMIWVNEAWLKIFGLDSKDPASIDRSARFYYPSEEEYQRVGEILYHNIENGGVNETEAQMRRWTVRFSTLILRSRLWILQTWQGKQLRPLWMSARANVRSRTGTTPKSAISSAKDASDWKRWRRHRT